MRSERAFTLTELLVVLGIIGFLAAAILVAVDPVRRVQDARDAQRYVAVNALLNAVLTKQVDDRAQYNGEAAAPIDSGLMTSQVIVGSLRGIDCTVPADAPTCDDDGALSPDYGGSYACVADLSGLVPTYIPAIPIDPFGAAADPTPGTADRNLGTPTQNNNSGYYINRTAGNRILIGSCWGEANSSISAQR